MNRLEQVRQIVIKNKAARAGYMDLHKIIVNFVEYEGNIHWDSGVYMIEDFYIGKTNSIKNRLTNHILECFYDFEDYGLGERFNEKKCEAIKKVLIERKLKVTLLSKNESDERDYIIKYVKEGYNLTNINIPKEKIKKKKKKKKQNK